MSLRQSVPGSGSSTASASKSSQGKSAPQKELYDFLPRTGVRSGGASAVVEQPFLSSSSYTAPEIVYDIEHPRADTPHPHAHTRHKPTRAERARHQATIARVVLTLALLLLIAAGAYAAYLYHESSAVQKYAAPVMANDTVQSAFPGESGINLVIIGRDYDYNNQDQVLRTHARSDMLMVAHLDFANNYAHLLSIPRDTAAVIPGHGINKINAAHAIGGPQLTEATIAQNYGITANNYIALDFDGFQQAIDQLGGVDCTVDKKMDYDDNWGHLHIHLLPGFQHLDGEQAMDFVRFRHSDSDVVRTHRQQTLMAAIKAKLMEPQSLALLPRILDTIDQHIDSDLNTEQKVALARFIHDLPAGSIQMLTMPTTLRGPLTLTDYGQAQPIVRSWFNATIPASASRVVEHHRHREPRRILIAAQPAPQPIYD